MRYLLVLAAYLPMQVLTYIVTPVLPLFARERVGALDNNNGVGMGPRLPTWLSWFDTPDNSLNGDPRFRAENKEGYLSKVKWLYRNSLYGFKWNTLAVDITHPELIEGKGNPAVNRNNGEYGVFKAKYPNGVWQFKYVKPLIGSKGIMLNMGWELNSAYTNGKPGKKLFMFSPRIVTFK